MNHTPATIALLATALASRAALAQTEAEQPAVQIGAPAVAAPPTRAAGVSPYAYDTEAPRRAAAPSAYDGDPARRVLEPRVFNDVGGPIPDGAHRESRPTWGLIVAGIATFSVFYTGSLMYGIATCGIGTDCTNGHAGLYVPVVGPFIAAAMAPTSGGAAFATFDGAVQTLSLVGIIAGAMIRHPVVVVPAYAANGRPRVDRSARFALLPGTPGAAVGATLSVATF